MPNPLYDAFSVAISGQFHGICDRPTGAHSTHDQFNPLCRTPYAKTPLPTRADSGRRVAVQSQIPRLRCALCACVQAGLVFLPLNPGYTASRGGYFAQLRCAAAGLILPCQRTGPRSAVAGAAVETMDAPPRHAARSGSHTWTRHIRQPVGPHRRGSGPAFL